MIDIAVFDEDLKIVKTYERLLVKPLEKQTLVEFDQKPYAVFLNYNNYGYLRARNDD